MNLHGGAVDLDQPRRVLAREASISDIFSSSSATRLCRKRPRAFASQKGNSMSDDKDKQSSEADAALEREIRQGRKFTAQEALGRMIGPGAMKGGSAVPRVQEAETAIGTWLRSNLADSTGALPAVLHRHLNGSELLLNNLDQPLLALAAYCRQVLASAHHLEELVREADVEWGQR